MKSLQISNIVHSLLILFLFFSGGQLVYGQPGVKQGPPVPVSFCIDADEMELAHMINAYRKEHGLAPVPVSKSLSYVADLHVKDLYFNQPDRGVCNSHSWSDKGKWLPFCYPRDENKKNSVWDKPRELTKYPVRAYEIVYWENNPLVKDTVFMVWKMEAYFNSFLLNTGKWQGKTWNAIGIAVYENYACAWFGESPDPAGEAIICGSQPENQVTDRMIPASEKTLKKEQIEHRPVTADSLAKRDSVSGIYFIIVKTNLSREAADKLVYTLNSNEYPAARVLEKDGKIRVSVFESTDKSTVMVKLKEVKKTYKDAWLLKK